MPKSLPFNGVYFYPKGRGSYLIQFRHPESGRLKSITIRSSSEALAYEQAVDLGRRFESGLFDPWEDRPKDCTVVDAIKAYLGHNPKLSPLTIRERRIVLESFARDLPMRMEVRSVSRKHVGGFASAPHLKPSTQKGYLSKLRGFFNWLVAEGYLRDSPCAELKNPTVPRKLPTFLSREEVNVLVATAKTHAILGTGPEWMPDVIRLAVATGLRQAELCGLRWSDVDFHSQRIYVRTYVQGGRTHRTKSSHERSIPMLPAATDVLQSRSSARLNEDEYATIFVGSKNGPLYPGFVKTKFASLRKRAGLQKPYSFHTLRHTFASWLVSSGVPIRHVQSYLGHDDIKTTMIYAHLDESQFPDIAAAAMPPIRTSLDAEPGDLLSTVERELKNLGLPWTTVDSEALRDFERILSEKQKSALSAKDRALLHERNTGLEPATSTLARLRSTN